MKAVFNPTTDSVQEVLHFVEFCYDRGLELHIETYGAPKVRRSARKSRRIQQNIEEDRESFEKGMAELDKKSMKVTREPVVEDETKPSPKPGGRKKRSPDITKAIYLRIKNGDSEVIQMYAPHTVSKVMNTRSWPQYLAFKADQARKKRIRHSSKRAAKKK